MAHEQQYYFSNVETDEASDSPLTEKKITKMFHTFEVKIIDEVRKMLDTFEAKIKDELFEVSWNIGNQLMNVEKRILTDISMHLSDMGETYVWIKRNQTETNRALRNIEHNNVATTTLYERITEIHNNIHAVFAEHLYKIRDIEAAQKKLGVISTCTNSLFDKHEALQDRTHVLLQKCEKISKMFDAGNSDSTVQAIDENDEPMCSSCGCSGRKTPIAEINADNLSDDSDSMFTANEEEKQYGKCAGHRKPGPRVPKKPE